MDTLVEEVLVGVHTHDHRDETLPREKVLEQPRQFALSEGYYLSLARLSGSEFGVVFEGGDALSQGE